MFLARFGSSLVASLYRFPLFDLLLAVGLHDPPEIAHSGRPGRAGHTVFGAGGPIGPPGQPAGRELSGVTGPPLGQTVPGDGGPIGPPGQPAGTFPPLFALTLGAATKKEATKNNIRNGTAK